ANAALLADAADGHIAAMVLDDPVDGFAEVLTQHIALPHPCLRWLRPLCKWTFEIAYEVDAEDLDLQRYHDVLNQRSMLLFDNRPDGGNFSSPAKLEQIRQFLKSRCEAPAVAGADQK